MSQPRSLPGSGDATPALFATAAEGQKVRDDPQLFIAGVASGSKVLTDRGRLDVTGLKAGDRVWTMEAGLRALKFCGHQGFVIKPKTSYLRPVCIAAGALGGGKPSVDVKVAPGQRILIDDWRIATYLGLPEMLVCAVDLVGQAGITRALPDGSFSYSYLQFQDFEMIEVEGMIVESVVRDRQLSMFSSAPMRNSRALAPSRPLLLRAQAEILRKIDVDQDTV